MSTSLVHFDLDKEVLCVQKFMGRKFAHTETSSSTYCFIVFVDSYCCCVLERLAYKLDAVRAPSPTRVQEMRYATSH